MLNHNVARQGTYWRCFHLGRALAARGHEVTLFTKHSSARFRIHRWRDDGVDVIATPRGVLGRLHLGELGVLDIAPRVAHVLRRRPDVLMAFGAQPDVALPFFVSRRFGAARLHVADRDDLKRGALLETAFRGTRLEWWIPYGERWERRLPEQADAVTTISRRLEDDTLAWGIDGRKVLFLPSGADVERIQVRSREEARRRLRAAARRAGVRLRDVRRRAGAGPAPAGRAAREGGAAGRPLRLRRPSRPVPFGRAGVLETGPVPPDEVQWWVAAADVALLPYLDSDFNRARWPIKLGEYIAAGRPVVACDIGELGRVVAEHDLGLLARPDMSDFADRVLELLRDPVLAQAHRRAGASRRRRALRLARPRREARGVPL